MASSLRVNAIVPASGTNVAIGTAGGTITYTASVSGVSTFSNGIIVAAGTTAAPAISPSGDSNTGIFFPSADTIAFAEGGAESARFDSNGRLGIGTQIPSAVINVRSSAAELARFTNTGSNGGDWEIKLGGGGFEDRKFMLTDKFGGTDNVRLSVDSAGRVTKPFQPYFYARTGRTGADGYTNNPYRFEDVLHNVGGHFVTSGTGAYERFVAPVAGIYCFQSSPGYKQTSVDWNVRIRINGTEYAEIGRFIGSPSSHSTIGGSVTLKLSANDYVDLNNGGNAYHINTTFNFFCGYLLG
jgi:hypothetical protein